MVLLAALTGLTALSIDMSLPATSQMQRTFHAGTASVQLTLSLFLLGFAMGQLVCGPLSDRVGRRPVLLGGMAHFTDALFRKLTGKELIALWAEFAAAEPAKAL